MKYGERNLEITTLAKLNEVIGQFGTPLPAITLGAFLAPGKNAKMLDEAIEKSNLFVYDEHTQAEIIAEILPKLKSQVNDSDANFKYDTHGDKHFSGGTHGTKFIGVKTTVNAFITGLIDNEKGRIRRHANGTKKTYYMITNSNKHTTGQQKMVVQVDYKPSPEEFGFHGYPDDSAQISVGLKETKGGTAIPL